MRSTSQKNINVKVRKQTRERLRRTEHPSANAESLDRHPRKGVASAVGVLRFKVLKFIFLLTFHDMGIRDRISRWYPFFFSSVGVRDKISRWYPFFFSSVGIRDRISLRYPSAFPSVGIRDKTSFRYPFGFPSAGIRVRTSLWYPLITYIMNIWSHLFL